MISPDEFLKRIGIDDQPLRKKYSAGSDWSLLNLLKRFSEMNNNEKLLHEFWQRSSDACPLEASQAEHEEKGFEKWIKEQQNKPWQEKLS